MDRESGAGAGGRDEGAGRDKGVRCVCPARPPPARCDAVPMGYHGWGASLLLHVAEYDMGMDMGKPKKPLVELAFALLNLSDRMHGIMRYDETMTYSWALGATLTLDIIRYCPERLSCVYVSNERKPERYHDESIALAKAAGVPVLYDEKAFTARAGRRYYSVLCEFEKWEDSIEPGSHVVIVDVNNEQNIGAILRSSLAFGVLDVAVIGHAFDSFSPQVMRTSMGTRLQLRVEAFPTVEAYIARFPQNARYAFMLDAATPLRQVEKRKPYSLFVGNESAGLPPEYTDMCQPVFIEQSSRVDSLNVSVATAIALYQFSGL